MVFILCIFKVSKKVIVCSRNPCWLMFTSNGAKKMTLVAWFNENKLTRVFDKLDDGLFYFQAKQHREGASTSSSSKADVMKTVFGQVFAKMDSLLPDYVMMPQRVWKVKFSGRSYYFLCI